MISSKLAKQQRCEFRSDKVALQHVVSNSHADRGLTAKSRLLLRRKADETKTISTFKWNTGTLSRQWPVSDGNSHDSSHRSSLSVSYIRLLHNINIIYKY